MRLRPRASESGPQSGWPTPSPTRKTVTTGATALEPSASPKDSRMAPNAGSMRSMASAVRAMSMEMSTMNSRWPMARPWLP